MVIKLININICYCVITLAMNELPNYSLLGNIHLSPKCKFFVIHTNFRWNHPPLKVSISNSTILTKIWMHLCIGKLLNTTMSMMIMYKLWYDLESMFDTLSICRAYLLMLMLDVFNFPSLTHTHCCSCSCAK